MITCVVICDEEVADGVRRWGVYLADEDGDPVTQIGHCGSREAALNWGDELCERLGLEEVAE